MHQDVILLEDGDLLYLAAGGQVAVADAAALQGRLFDADADRADRMGLPAILSDVWRPAPDGAPGANARIVALWTFARGVRLMRVPAPATVRYLGLRPWEARPELFPRLRLRFGAGVPLDLWAAASRERTWRLQEIGRP